MFKNSMFFLLFSTNCFVCTKKNFFVSYWVIEKLCKMLQLEHFLQSLQKVKNIALFQILQNVAIYALLWKYFGQEPLLRVNLKNFGTLSEILGEGVWAGRQHDLMSRKYLNKYMLWRFNSIVLLKGNQILLSLAPILMQALLAPIFLLKCFLVEIFLFDANKRICFCFKEFPTFT